MKIVKKALIITLSVLFAAACAWFALERYAERTLAREFGRATGGRYSLAVGRIGVDPFRRVFIFNDITISKNDAPTSAEPLSTAPSASSHPIDFSAREVLAVGLNNNGNGFTVSEIQLIRPRLGRGETMRASVDRIVIGRRSDRTDTLRNVVEGLLFDGGRLNVRKVRCLNADESVRIEVDSLCVDTISQSLSVSRAALVPTYSKAEFARKSWRHADWTSLALCDLSCTGVDFAGLLRGRELHVESVRIGGGEVESFKDRNVKRKEWVKPMYHALIQHVPFRFGVRAVMFENLDIRYGELPLGGTEPGVLTIDDLTGYILNIGNLPDREPYASLTASARLMGVAPLSVTGRIPMRRGLDDFELKGVIDKCNMQIFSGMTTPLVGMELTAGTLRTLDFSIAGTSQRAHCDVSMIYDGLSVELIGNHGAGRDRRAISNFVNNRVLLTSNPSDGRARRSSGETERDPFRSPWSFIWKTLFAAVADTIGVAKLV